MFPHLRGGVVKTGSGSEFLPTEGFYYGDVHLKVITLCFHPFRILSFIYIPYMCIPIYPFMNRIYLNLKTNVILIYLNVPTDRIDHQELGKASSK